MEPRDPDMNIKFRLHQEVTEENLLRLTAFIKSFYTERYIVAGEVDAKRPHFQCFVSVPIAIAEEGDLKKTMKRFRNSFRYSYKDLLDTLPDGKKGNSLYSITLIAQNDPFPLEYCAYLMKENCMDMVGFSDEERAQIIEHNNKVVTEIRLKEQKKKQSQYAQIEEEFVSRLTEEVDEDGNRSYVMNTIGLRQAGSREPLSSYLVSLFVVTYWKDHELMVREFHMISIIQTLCLNYMHSGIGSLAQRLHEKITK